MTFNPLEHRGIPLDKQLRTWRELDVEPIDPDYSDPYTRCRVITMNGIEVEALMFSHQFARNCLDMDVKRQLAEVRYIEQQQQKAVNWLLPGTVSALETTIAYEQVAVDLTAWVARMEPDPYLKQAYEFGVLEDFDHLYRYANLYEMIQHRKAERIVDGLTEVMPGRPTKYHHRHPADNVRAPYDRTTAAPISKLHALTIMSAEQQTMNFYMNMGNRFTDPVARGLYLEIAMIEEQHVTQYESLLDPVESWFQQLVFHELNECYLYHSFMSQEVDPNIKRLWELHLNMELEHLRLAGELLRKYEGIEPTELLPKSLPQPVTFQSNKEYVRNVLATQVDLRTAGPNFVPLGQLPADSPSLQYQAMVNAGGFVPSEQVITDRMSRAGIDYRLETEGSHPVESLQQQPQAQM